MHSAILAEIVIMFVLSIGVVLVCHRFRLPSIVGFLLTGVLCGPSALGLISNMEAVDTMAEVGVAFLLFTIGMELSAKELMRMKHNLFAGGSTQVLFTIGVVMAIFIWSTGFATALVFGCLVALSSTAIVLSLLQQKAQGESPHGRMCLAILIFQDLAIVPMMLAFPLLGGSLETDSSHILIAAGKSIAVLGGVFLFARFLLPRLMLSVVRTRSRELMLMTTLGLCLAVALATAAIGLSLSLGAFLAGLMLAESEYSLNVVENVMPFKDVFTSIFFMSVGMLLNLDFFFAHIAAVMTLGVGVIVVKITVVFCVVKALRYSLRTAIITGFCLAQVGEFSFVLARSAMDLNLLNDTSYQAFLAASILTMTLTPVLMAIAPLVATRLTRKTGASVETPDDDGEDRGGSDQLRNHLIIIGFGIGGKNLARGARESGIPYIISEMNPDTVARYRNQEPIRHGDASFPLVLEHLGVVHARVLAIVVSDPVGSRAIIANARKLNPSLHIVVRSRFVGEVVALRELGANDVIAEEFEASIEVFASVLHHYLVPRQTINNFIGRIRGENYSMLRDLDMPTESISQLKLTLPDLQVASFSVEEGSPIANKTLAESSLRKLYNTTAAGIQRQDQCIISLSADTAMLPGDVVFLFGTQASLNAVATLFNTGGDEEDIHSDRASVLPGLPQGA